MNIDNKRDVLSRVLYDDLAYTLPNEKVDECYSFLVKRNPLDEFYKDELRINECLK